MDCSGFEDSQPSKAPFVFSRARFLRRARKYCSMSNAAAPHRYDTIAMLDRAKQMSGGQVNWITGVVHSELPGFFRLRKVAEAELAWCFDKCPQSVPCRLVARSRPPRKAGARKGGNARRGTSTRKGAVQRLEPTRHADHACLRGRRHRTDFCTTASRCDRARTGVRVNGLRVYRMLFRCIGR